MSVTELNVAQALKTLIKEKIERESVFSVALSTKTLQ